MKNIIQFTPVVERWKITSKATKIAIALFILLMSFLFFIATTMFLFAFGAMSDAFLIVLLIALIRPGRKKMPVGLLIGVLAAVAFSVFIHAFYRRFNYSYLFYFFILLQVIGLLSGTSKRKRNDSGLYIGRHGTIDFIRFAAKSTFSGLWVFLGFSVFFFAMGCNQIKTFNNIDFNNPTTLSVQAISKIKNRLPFSFQYRLSGYLPNGSIAAVGWNFDKEKPERFSKGDLLKIYPQHHSKWEFIAEKFLPEKSWRIKGGIQYNGEVIAGVVIFVIWLSFVTYFYKSKKYAID